MIFFILQKIALKHTNILDSVEKSFDPENCPEVLKNFQYNMNLFFHGRKLSNTLYHSR